jgi:ATP-binding protein involved in chromosome partitioning
MSNDVTKERVLEMLQKVKGPDGEGDIVSLGLVSQIVINKGKVYFSISVDPGRAQELESLRQAAEDVVKRIDGVKSCAVTLTADREPGQAAAPQGGSCSTGGAAGGGAGQIPMPNIKSIIAVASGKGGVGKSTTAVNLALAFSANGLKTGILDADIYGPSLPRLLGLAGQNPEPGDDGESIKPLKAFGMEVMSIGFLVDEDAPMIWRGPMVMSALTQMLQFVTWGDLDVLVVDMPPGTGDAQLTMSQSVPLAGAVIVSTPQDLALIDARKGLNMFKQVNVPVLGIVENMSYFLCPSCGERSDIFGHGGAKSEAEKIGAPFLGEVPLHMDIREKSDAGQPVVISDPDGPHAEIYRHIAEKAWENAEAHKARLAGSKPKIVME